MGLNEELEKMKFDTRLVDWNLKHKKIKEGDLKKHLSELPDCSHNVDRMAIPNPAGGGSIGPNADSSYQRQLQ